MSNATTIIKEKRDEEEEIIMIIVTMRNYNNYAITRTRARRTLNVWGEKRRSKKRCIRGLVLFSIARRFCIFKYSKAEILKEKKKGKEKKK